VLKAPRSRSAPAPGALLSVSTVADPRPGRAVVEVVGEVDSYTAPVLDLCLRSRAGRPGVRELVVDLGQVTFLGAAGVEVLADADHRCRRHGARLVVRTGGRRAVLCPLRLAGFADRVAVDPDDGGRALRIGPRTGRVHR
jgi:anti-sigma B factor antagonist